MKNIFVSAVLLSCLSALACSAAGTVGQEPENANDSADGGSSSTPSPSPSASSDAAAPIDSGPTVNYGSPEKIQPECKVSGRYNEYAKAGFENGFYAIKLTPKNYPFQVDSLSYTLKNGTVVSNSGTTQCDANVPHKLGFFKSAAGQPATMPPDIQIWDAAGSGTDREESLPKPIVLEKGEVGYLLIQFVQGAAATCVLACSTGATPGIHFRTPKAATPFSWTAYAPSGNILASMNGRAILP